MFEQENFEYKIDHVGNDRIAVADLQKYLNDRGLEGWRVVYANNGVIWWMRRKP